MLGKLQYERFVAPYKVNKEIYYEISPDYTNKIVNLELSAACKEKYLNLSYNIINCDEFEDNAIGKFLLYAPNENSIVQGLKYLIKKEQLFYLEYIPILEQDIMKGDELISGITAYARDMKLVLRLQRKVIKIYFT